MASQNRLEDLEDIRQVRIDYTYFWDAGDAEGTASVFTDDAVIETHYQGKPFAAGGAEGKEAIRAYYARHMKSGQGDDRGKALHIVSNPQIRLTGPDTATGTWILTDIAIGQASPEKPPQILYGTYNDDYRKVDGIWKIQRMNLQVLYVTDQWFRDHNLVQDSG